MNKDIPVNNVVFYGNEKTYLIECINSGWVSHEGAFVKKFETQFAAYVGRKHGIAVSSGSAALDIAVIAAGITTGDEVIMPAFSIISPALSILKAGALPVLVDSDPETFNMDPDDVESKITSRTKAIIAVHTYGLPVEMDRIIAIAKKYDLKIIEDAAEMHGQTYYNKMCGTFGDISIFSFYANKIITTGEGGMVLTDDDKVAEHCIKLRNLAFENKGPRFIHNELGFSNRMTNLQAALGVAQLERIHQAIDKKRSIGKYYNEHLAFLKDNGYTLPVEKTSYANNIYWVYSIVAPSKEIRDKCIQHLNGEKIGTRTFFQCMHQQPVFKKMALFNDDVFEHSEKLSDTGFYIPSGTALTQDDMLRVTEVLKFFITLHKQ